VAIPRSENTAMQLVNMDVKFMEHILETMEDCEHQQISITTRGKLRDVLDLTEKLYDGFAFSYNDVCDNFNYLPDSMKEATYNFVKDMRRDFFRLLERVFYEPLAQGIQTLQ
jgi:hypothetical protein